MYNQFLQSHTRPAKTLSDLLTTRTTTGNVYLTISASLQLKVAETSSRESTRTAVPPRPVRWSST